MHFKAVTTFTPQQERLDSDWSSAQLRKLDDSDTNSAEDNTLEIIAMQLNKRYRYQVNRLQTSSNTGII